MDLKKLKKELKNVEPSDTRLQKLREDFRQLGLVPPRHNPELKEWWSTHKSVVMRRINSEIDDEESAVDASVSASKTDSKEIDSMSDN